MTCHRLHPVSPQRLQAALVVLALLLCFLGIGLAPAGAVGTTKPPATAPEGRATFGIKPSTKTSATTDTRARFEYSATPGAQQPDYVALSNDATSPAILSLYASDGFNTASDGYDLLPASEKPHDVGAWITLKTNTVTVQPGKTVIVPFLVRVPTKINPGDHVGGIVASLRTFGVDKKGDRVAIDHRVGVRVYLRIQGPLDPRLTVTHLRAKYSGSWWNPFSVGTVTLTYRVNNPGNVRLGAREAVDLTGWYGGTHAQSVPDLPELVPDNGHDEIVVLRGVRQAFHEHALVTVIPVSMPGETDGRVTNVVAGLDFWSVPWALLLLILVVALMIVTFWRSRRRRRRAIVVASPTKAPKTVAQA